MHPQELTPLGPFTCLREHVDQTIHCYLRLIESSQWGVDDPASSCLIYRSLLDVYPCIVGVDATDSDIFCLRHQNDKGDHILVNEELDIMSIIDWNGQKLFRNHSHLPFLLCYCHSHLTKAITS
ncbi:hypothetical protein K503DRAFT_822973 [Rhizopogon vinicolor AM-OR11-026]|uniref:Aminoglycoside phosphotransferase domain-containing protein n=1 Tax=Rhizopogon vinicolor AM-OR11-026 TaxID=1314800 RepID=A0A1B7MWW5_9AGAM|nr:hypothetical protein K503DRAFT_822973 [Rhizopogon vinicolor AM-OR11-026]